MTTKEDTITTEDNLLDDLESGTIPHVELEEGVTIKKKKKKKVR